jgi:hypothetical protein
MDRSKEQLCSITSSARARKDSGIASARLDPYS